MFNAKIDNNVVQLWCYLQKSNHLEYGGVTLGQVGSIDPNEKNYTIIPNIIYHKYNFNFK